jgi:hypothetical protein
MSIFKNVYSEFKKTATELSELELVLRFQDDTDQRIKDICFNEFVRRYNKYCHKKAFEMAGKLPMHILGMEVDDLYTLMLQCVIEGMECVKREKIAAGKHFTLHNQLEIRSRAVVQLLYRRMQAKKRIQMYAVEDDKLRNLCIEGSSLEDMVLNSIEPDTEVSVISFAVAI